MFLTISEKVFLLSNKLNFKVHVKQLLMNSSHALINLLLNKLVVGVRFTSATLTPYSHINHTVKNPELPTVCTLSRFL